KALLETLQVLVDPGARSPDQVRQLLLGQRQIDQDRAVALLDADLLRQIEESLREPSRDVEERRVFERLGGELNLLGEDRAEPQRRRRLGAQRFDEHVAADAER